MIRASLLGAALLCAPLPALAQPATEKPAVAPIAPAQLEAAKLVVAKVFPDGTYKKMMGESFSKMMDGMMDSMGQLPMRSIAAMGNLSEDQLAELGDTPLAEVMTIYDPHFRERMQIGTRAMMDSMTDLMGSMEPRVRAGLGRAYARRFSAQQLGELNAFFSTPTGGTYAAESMSLYMDPEVMTEMTAMMPELMAKMPDFIKAMETSTASLPKPRKIDELSKAEKAKLAKLLGVKEKDLRDPPAAPTFDKESGI